MQQKARINWRKMGDDNTRFFFTSTKARPARNKIVMLVDSNGHTLIDQQDITNEIMGFYKNLLGLVLHLYQELT